MASGISWWIDLISCRVDYQCLVLTNSCINGYHIGTRGQYIRGFNFLSEQLKAVGLKFRVLDFCRKRLIGVEFILTFIGNDWGVQNDQGIGLPWHSSERTLLSHHYFLQHQFIAWLDSSFASVLCNRTSGRFTFWTLVLERVKKGHSSQQVASLRVIASLSLYMQQAV